METENNRNNSDKNSEPVLVNNTESIITVKVLNHIISKWWLILLVGLVGSVAGFVYASSQKPVYQSYLSFALDEGGAEGGMSAAMGLASQFGISLGGAQDVFTGDNIIEIMLSRRIIEDVLLSVDTFNSKPITLIEFYRQNELPPGKNNTKGNIHFYTNELRSSFSYAKDSILYNTYLKFKKDFVTARRPDKKLNIYELMVTSPNEKFSKIFTDKLIDKTNHFYTEISSKKAKETLEILEKRVPDMKSKLEASISDKAAIQDANLNTAFANALVPLLKEQSNSQVYGTAYAEMFKNLEIARFQYLKSIPLLQIIDAADYPMIKIKVGKLKSAIIFGVVTTFIFLMIFVIINIFRYKKAS
jgi:hypothetical protein